ncbi:MAG: tRNAHis guanylyltransferase [Methanosaeta sp. NSM2]|nr:tRNA 5'-guanylyltransferase [Methanothrix sp.]MRR14227.1 tRNA 5'-guanylyltransferase [archaeon]OYV13249.1 MAG: tRNAHis guanylyltransferase [Methanosaeta sp. NSM2]
MQRISERSASREIFSGLYAPAPLAARADGRGFKKLLQGKRKPYDIDFARSMVRATEGIFSDSGLAPAFAFTFSDEVSLIYLKAPLAGRVEKIDSLVAGYLSAALSLETGRIATMDCRTIPICPEEIRGYLVERQNETWRNHVFSYGFYMLRDEGLDPVQAMGRLRGMAEPEIHELVFQKGINLARTPAWERRGVMVYRKDGKLESDWELPLLSSAEGPAFLEKISGIECSRH